MDAGTLKTYQENFQQLLLRHPPQKGLPDLIIEKKETLSWWQEILKKIKEWLDHQSPDTSNWLPVNINFSFIIEIVFYVLVVLLFSYLVYWLIQSFQKNSEKEDSKQNAKPSSVNLPKANSTEDYQLAMQSQDYSRAARLYWKNFLKSKQLPRSMTLEEWKSGIQFPDSSQVLQKVSKLMFGNLSQPEEAFKEWLSWMERIACA